MIYITNRNSCKEDFMLAIQRNHYLIEQLYRTQIESLTIHFNRQLSRLLCIMFML